MLQNNIKNIDKSLHITPDLNKSDIKHIYDEANIYFTNNMNRTLDELENFIIS